MPVACAAVSHAAPVLVDGSLAQSQRCLTAQAAKAGILSVLVKVARAAGSVQDARARWLRELAAAPALPVVFIAAEDADRLEAMAQTPACERTPSAVADEDVVHRGATCCRHPD